MIKIIDGDLLQANVPLIAHQTNCLGVMGAGIAKAIKNKWPGVYTQYKDFCKDFNYSRVLLGLSQLCKTNDNPIKYVANLFGEYSYTKSISPYENRHTDYYALETALLTLKADCMASGIKEIGIPYKLGCGLAGGDWDNVVYPMLKKLFEDDPEITLYIYKLCKN
jgi:O-acetyl-ADP-ribose deacetylase (regulator of RNase III)